MTKAQLMARVSELESTVAADMKEIAELQRMCDVAQDEVDSYDPPPPDWFAQPEPYEQMYARLHPHRAERAGTNPAPWSW